MLPSPPPPFLCLVLSLSLSFSAICKQFDFICPTHMRTWNALRITVCLSCPSAALSGQRTRERGRQRASEREHCNAPKWTPCSFILHLLNFLTNTGTSIKQFKSHRRQHLPSCPLCSPLCLYLSLLLSLSHSLFLALLSPTPPSPVCCQFLHLFCCALSVSCWGGAGNEAHGVSSVQAHVTSAECTVVTAHPSLPCHLPPCNQSPHAHPERRPQTPWNWTLSAFSA